MSRWQGERGALHGFVASQLQKRAMIKPMSTAPPAPEPLVAVTIRVTTAELQTLREGRKAYNRKHGTTLSQSRYIILLAVTRARQDAVEGQFQELQDRRRRQRPTAAWKPPARLK